MYFDKCFQFAYVCRNLEKGVQTLRDEHGVDGKWIYFEPDMEVNTSYGGRGNCKVKVGLVWVDDIQYELIEPVSGLVQHYTEFLPDDDSLRFHHTCMRWDDWESARAEAEKWPIAYEGAVPGCNFVYIDARKTLGHYLEYMWMSPEMWAATGPNA